MSKLPAFQFYPGDWRKDPGVQSLTFEDRGIWFEILLIMHESEDRGKLLLNGKPMPEEALARMLGLDPICLTKTLTTLLTYGVASREPNSGAIYSRRMVRDEKLRKTRAECGKLGGNPALLNQKSNQTPTTPPNQNPTPSSSSSSSSSSSEIKSSRADANGHQKISAVFQTDDQWGKLEELAERGGLVASDVERVNLSHRFAGYPANDRINAVLCLERRLAPGGEYTTGFVPTLHKYIWDKHWTRKDRKMPMATVAPKIPSLTDYPTKEY